MDIGELNEASLLPASQLWTQADLLSLSLAFPTRMNFYYKPSLTTYSLLEWLLLQEQGKQGTLLPMSILESAHLNDYSFLMYFNGTIFPIQVKRSI